MTWRETAVGILCNFKSKSAFVHAADHSATLRRSSANVVEVVINVHDASRARTADGEDGLVVLEVHSCK